MKMKDGRTLSELRVKRILAGYTIVQLSKMARLSTSVISLAERGISSKRTTKRLERVFRKIEASKSVAENDTQR